MIKISLNGNGVCSLYVSLQNGFVQGNQGFILLSYDIGLINDDDFLLLYPSYISQNLDLPFRTACNSNHKAKQQIESSISTQAGCSYNVISPKIQNF
jgi:hypothetical protein